MKDELIKLRVKCHLRLKIFWSEITEPFQIAIECIKHYLALRKIDKESNDGWERYVKRRELERKDEFHLLKTQLIAAFLRTICAGSSAGLKEGPDEVDNSRKEFQKNKEELMALLEKICDYDEIIFDEKIKSEIISWKFETFEMQEEISDLIKEFLEYICTL